MFLRILAAILIMTAWVAPVTARDNEDREGGIIGTGIVGTITDLGSIIVNGLHLEITDDMPVDGAIPAMNASELRPGHTVAIVAERQGDDWYARNIRQVYPLVGEVSATTEAGITVMGTEVELNDLLPEIKVGDWVAISGLWQGQKVNASMIERLPRPQPEARLSGTYLGPDRNGNDMVGDTVIIGIRPSHLQPGDLVRVFGRPTPNGIDATRLETHLFGERVGVVQVQGYYSTPQPDGLYTVLGSGLVAYTDQPEMIDGSTKIIECGENGRLGNVMADPSGSEPDTRVLQELGC